MTNSATDQAPVIDVKDVDLSLTPDNAVGENKLQDIHSMAATVMQWHHKVTSTLEHMCAIPDGAELEYAHEEDPTKVDKITLTGDALLAFRLGIVTALNVINVLPFQVVTAPDEDASN